MGKKASSSTAASASASATEMKRKKKKGRPSLTDLQNRKINKNNNFIINNNNKNNYKINTQKTLTPFRRSTRRNAIPSNSPASSNGDSDGDEVVEDDDDEDERKKKKVKLVVRLPQSNSNQGQQNSQHSDSGSGSGDDAGSGSDGSDADMDLGGDNHVSSSPEKQTVNAVDGRSADVVEDQEEKIPKVTDNQHGLQLASGPTTTPLPERKLLVFILDRLQKKDTYRVFSEPVDPDELPDYHEIIKQPMDFGTVRKKLADGLYSNLEELEADVLLICSNAMKYNAPDTVYFRQARTIQEIANRDFANLRHEGDDGEPQPKIVRRGRPPSKNQKKSVDESPADRVGPEHSSGATLASGEDKAVASDSYSLRKGPMLLRHRSSDAFVTPHRSRNGENQSDWSIDWNSEFPASILRADMKYGKKNIIVDENKRDTYNDYQPTRSGNDLSSLYNFDGDMNRLVAVGFHYETHGYARSLARFAADLGPIAWKIASRKIEPILPAGVKFGPGWVGENEARTELSSFPTDKQKSSTNSVPDSHSSRPLTPPTSVINSSGQSKISEEMVEAVRRLNSQNELSSQGNASPWGMQGSSVQVQQKPVLNPNRNGLSGMLGYKPSSQMGLITGQSGVQEGSIPYQMLGGMLARNDTSSLYQKSASSPVSEEPKSVKNWPMIHSGNSFLQGNTPRQIADSKMGISGKAPLQEMSVEHRRSSLPIQPDLNLRVRGPGSPSSSLHIGSPQQPDLALQL